MAKGKLEYNRQGVTSQECKMADEVADEWFFGKLVVFSSCLKLFLLQT